MRLGALLALCASAAAAQDLPAPDLPALFAVTGVAAGDVLNLRAAPSASADALGALPPGARVEVVARSGDGRWGLVARGEGGGWARLSFLAREGEPGRLAPPLLCLGTEPFWSVRAEAGAGRFETPDGGRDLRPIGAGAGVMGLVLAFDDGGRTLDLTVARSPCSDGMSDRPYGLAALLWDREGAPLEGCCTLDLP